VVGNGAAAAGGMNRAVATGGTAITSVEFVSVGPDGAAALVEEFCGLSAAPRAALQVELGVSVGELGDVSVWARHPRTGDVVSTAASKVAVKPAEFAKGPLQGPANR
jgi:hypothetical protein